MHKRHDRHSDAKDTMNQNFQRQVFEEYEKFLRGVQVCEEYEQTCILEECDSRVLDESLATQREGCNIYFQ